MLLAIIEYRSTTTNRKSKCHLFECDTCNSVFRAEASRSRARETQFCDTKCYGQYRTAHPEMWAASIKAMNAPGEHRVHAIAKRQAKWNSGELLHPFLGRKHSNKSIKQMSVSHKGLASGEKNGMFGRRHSEETRHLMSEAKSRLILEGKFHAYGTRNKKGWYTSSKTSRRHFFRSSWEEALMVWLDKSDKISDWDYECVRIEYVYNDNKRWYVPDFLVTSVDSGRCLYEIKPKEFKGSVKMMAQLEAAEKWCALNHVASIVVLNKEALLEMGVEFRPIYEVTQENA